MTPSRSCARGHHARAFDLPGRDGDPTISLDDYVATIGSEVDAAIAESGEKPILVAHSMGGVSVNPAIAPDAFYGRCDPGVVTAALPRLGPEPVGPLATPLSLGAGFASVRKTWIAGTEDRTVPYALQQAHAAACGATLQTLEADHSPNYSARDEFINLLLGLG